MLGGRTNHWGRISLRFGPDDFRRKSLDGLGDDWPITYEDMKPFYDRVDSLVGIFGSKEGLPNDPDGIFLPPPKPRCYELLIKQAADRAENHLHCQPPVDPDAAAQRPDGVPLLRPVRPRLRAALEFFVAVGADSSGDGDQEADDRQQRHGPRGDGRRDRTRDRRRVHRQEHRSREPRPGTHRRARGERLRVGSHPAQLEVVEVPAGARQFDRERRQVPDRYDRSQRAGVHPEADERRAAQRGWRRRHARLHAVVGRQQEARFPARLSHRAERRPRHALVRLHGRRAQSGARGGDRDVRRRVPATASRSRTTTAASTARRSTSPAAAR